LCAFGFVLVPLADLADNDRLAVAVEFPTEGGVVRDDISNTLMTAGTPVPRASVLNGRVAAVVDIPMHAELSSLDTGRLDGRSLTQGQHGQQESE